MSVSRQVMHRVKLSCCSGVSRQEASTGAPSPHSLTLPPPTGGFHQNTIFLSCVVSGRREITTRNGKKSLNRSCVIFHHLIYDGDNVNNTRDAEFISANAAACPHFVDHVSSDADFFFLQIAAIKDLHTRCAFFPPCK